MTTELVLRKVGDSLVLSVPEDIVRKKKLKANQTIRIDFVEKADLTSIFGTLKTDVPTQKLKDMARDGTD